MKIFILLFLICIGNSLFAEEQNLKSRNVKDQKAIDENSKKADQQKYNRRIYLKLPFLQPEFHWIFTERDKFLKGQLILIISSNEVENKIILFKDGKINKEWQELGCQSNHKNNQIYFGFQSKNEYSVSEIDKVELILKLDNDIKGKGADSTGVLKSGEYESSSQFTLYHLEKSSGEKDVYAFLNNDDWNVRWKLDITANKGWLEDRYNKKNRDKLINDRNDYTIGFMIGKDGKRSISIVDHKLKQFYFESFRNHNDFWEYIKENKANMPLGITCTGEQGEEFIKICKDLESVLAPIKLAYYDSIRKEFVGPRLKDLTDYSDKYQQK